MAKTLLPMWPSSIVESVCEVLADTDTGLPSSEIGRLLAKIGVPAAYFDNGTEIIGKPAGWGAKKIEEWENRDYHQPSDELTEDWDLSGAVEDTRLAFRLGARVANADAMPRWVPGDEFEAARKKALAEVREPVAGSR